MIVGQECRDCQARILGRWISGCWWCGSRNIREWWAGHDKRAARLTLVKERAEVRSGY